MALVGPLPPPAGGMANQTRQLGELLRAEGAVVEVVQVNPPYWPAWIGKLLGVRALFRLVPYLVRLWRATGRAEVIHIMANSGWSWHLFAAPAVWIAKLRGKRAIVNYRGGSAETFLKSSFRWMRPTLQVADKIVVPSGFLQAVFGKWGIMTTVIPNIVNLPLFSRAMGRTEREQIHAPRLVVTRNLEPIYDIPTVLRALALLLRDFPRAHLTIAGSGPERAALETLASQLGIVGSVTFTGRLDIKEVAALYRSADVAINPSRVDNMPNSVLEALASGVPVVSTNVGGVPYIVQNRQSALLVPPGNPRDMAEAVADLLNDPGLRRHLIDNGLTLVKRYAWPNVREQWLSAYGEPLHGAPRRSAASAKG